MKKSIFLCFLMGVCLSDTAQIVPSVQSEISGEYFQVILPHVTPDNTPRLYAYSAGETEGVVTFYDENLQKTGSMSFPSYKGEAYNLDDCIYEIGWDDYDSGSTSDDDFVTFSMTLFNNDPLIEYLVPVIEELSYKYAWSDEIYSSRFVTGFCLKNENGETLQTVKFESGKCNSVDYNEIATIFKIRQKLYLAFPLRSIDENMIFQASSNPGTLVCYPINQGTDGVAPLGAPVKISVSPTSVRRNDFINIDIGKASETGGEVVVTNVSGKAVMHKAFLSGQQNLQLNASGLHPGVYVVSIHDGREGTESCKLIVK